MVMYILLNNNREPSLYHPRISIEFRKLNALMYFSTFCDICSTTYACGSISWLVRFLYNEFLAVITRSFVQIYREHVLNNQSFRASDKFQKSNSTSSGKSHFFHRPVSTTTL